LSASLREPDASDVFRTVIASIREAAATGEFSAPADPRQFQQVEGILKAHHEFLAGARDNKDAYELAKTLDDPDTKHWMRNILQNAHEEKKSNAAKADHNIDILLDLHAVMKSARMQPRLRKSARTPSDA